MRRRSLYSDAVLIELLGADWQSQRSCIVLIIMQFSIEQNILEQLLNGPSLLHPSSSTSTVQLAFVAFVVLVYMDLGNDFLDMLDIDFQVIFLVFQVEKL